MTLEGIEIGDIVQRNGVRMEVFQVFDFEYVNRVGCVWLDEESNLLTGRFHHNDLVLVRRA